MATATVRSIAAVWHKGGELWRFCHSRRARVRPTVDGAARRRSREETEMNGFEITELGQVQRAGEHARRAQGRRCAGHGAKIDAGSPGRLSRRRRGLHRRLVSPVSTTMIARIWSGATATHCRRSGVRALHAPRGAAASAAVPGNRLVLMLRRDRDDQPHGVHHDHPVGGPRRGEVLHRPRTSRRRVLRGGRTLPGRARSSGSTPRRVRAASVSAGLVVAWRKARLWPDESRPCI